MEKNRLLFVPFLAGLLLMFYSWYLSFPLSVNSVNDTIFNHVSILYWISLPLLLASMTLIALSFKNAYLKWLMTVGCVLTLFSLWYFYFMISTIDSMFFRGLTDYFVKTHSLDASQVIHSYYQWPLYY